MTYHIEEKMIALVDQRLKGSIDSGDIVASVLSTRGGRPLAWGNKFHGIKPEDIAKLATSTTNLGSLLMKEEDASRFNRIICDVNGSPVIVTEVQKLLLTFVGEKHANIGKVAGIADHMANHFRKNIIIDVKAQKDVSKSGQDKKPAGTAVPDMEQETTGSVQDKVNDRFVFDAEGFTAKVMADLEALKKSSEE